MSCPVVFHILFIQLNLGPRPSHLPAALTRSNWLTGPFSLISPQSAEQLLEQPARPGAGTRAGPVLLLACSLLISSLLSLPELSAQPRHQAGETVLVCFPLCAPACRDPHLAHVPVSERVCGSWWGRDSLESEQSDLFSLSLVTYYLLGDDQNKNQLLGSPCPTRLHAGCPSSCRKEVKPMSYDRNYWPLGVQPAPFTTASYLASTGVLVDDGYQSTT